MKSLNIPLSLLATGSSSHSGINLLRNSVVMPRDVDDFENRDDFELSKVEDGPLPRLPGALSGRKN